MNCRKLVIALTAVTLVAILATMPFPSISADIPIEDKGTVYSLDIRFTFTGSDAERVEWDFGDGSDRLVGEEVVHHYAKPGEYIITQYAYNSYDPDNNGTGSESIAKYRLNVAGYPWIDFESNGGTPVDTIRMTSAGSTAQAATQPEDPVKAGYSFDGWYTDGDFTTKYVWTSLVTEPFTLYAKWVEDATTGSYVVIWKDYDGTELDRDENVGEGSAPTYGGTTPVRPSTIDTCYSFSGWSSESDGSGNITFTATYSANDHKEGVLAAVAPSCTSTGLTQGKVCSVCGTTTVPQEIIAATGHSPTAVPGSDPTCTETGLTTGSVCSVCGTTITSQSTIPALGHTVVINPAVEATCTETGLTEGKHCSVCDEVIVAQETVPAEGHTTIVDPAVTPTCTSTGLTEGKHCSVCDEVIVAQEILDKVPHSPSEAVEEDRVEPTVDATGHYDSVIYCSVCGQELSRETITIPQLEPAPGPGPSDPTDPPVTELTIRFDSQGGSSVAMQKVKLGDTASRPANPTRDGYTFDGWYTDRTCTDAYDWSTKVTSNITLYAGWTKVISPDDPVGPDDPVIPDVPTVPGDIVVNPDGSSSETTREEITNADGSVTTTESTTNRDPNGGIIGSTVTESTSSTVVDQTTGAVTETTTEKVTTTDRDGNESVVESTTEMVIESKVDETTGATVETTTEKVTIKDEAGVETTTETKIETTSSTTVDEDTGAVTDKRGFGTPQLIF